jgi:hypothetical protein
LADQYGDIVIITNEDPYDEKPEDIIDQVSIGVKNKEKLIKRKGGQDHFNSRESSKVTRNKRSDLGVYSTFARSMKKLISK